jgi:NitT/TauT family transport system substrate-binding protein
LAVPHLSNGLRSLVALLALSAALVPASAQEPVRIGIGFGLAFLPIYLCEDLKLIEKHGKAVHLDLKPSYQRFFGAGPLQDAIGAGTIDMGPFGTAPLLVAWERANGTPRQILAVSGITTLPLVLLTNQPNVLTIADFKPADRIAVPTSSSPQMYLLQMQSEKIFGQYDRLRNQIIVRSHADAVAGLVAATGRVAGYFSSAPYTQIAFADGRVHKLLSSSDVIGGKASFLIMGATQGYIAAHPQASEVVAEAIEEAAHIIRDDPRRAAEIYLAHEPSKTLDVAAVTAVLNDIKDEFGSAVHGVQAFADFMGRHGELKTPPRSWKEIVAPALVNSPST